MVTRHFNFRLQSLLRQFPVVCILGPRQCGKTTFAKAKLKNWQYLDLEKPSDLAKIEGDPQHFLSENPERVIFDEAQLCPSLFPVLRGVVDERRKKNGRFVLTGSASFQLTHSISESLSGRIGFLDLTPFQLDETPDLRRLWLNGGFPDAYKQKKSGRRWDWYESYTRTFIESDLARLGIAVSRSNMRRLWAMLSHVHGQLWNASAIAQSMATSYHTVNHYLDILEQTFLIRKLPPYFANISKRLVKSPKVYFRDTGLLHYFLGIQTQSDLAVHPKRGASFEGFAIEQIINTVSLRHTGAEFYFWRTATGQEVDLLIKIKNELIPVEVKVHSSPDKSLIRGLKPCLQDLKIKKGFLVYPGREEYSLGDGVMVVGLSRFMQKFRQGGTRD